MNKQNINLKDSFLISMPSSHESEYKDSLIYLCHHGLFGSMGFILNQTFHMDLITMLGHLNIPTNENITNQTLYRGGKIQSDRGFVLHPYDEHNNFSSSYLASNKLTLTSSTDILEAMALGQGPKKALIALGYINWQPGELESEIMNNLWLNCPANLDIIFDVAAKDKIQAAASLLGVNLDQLSSHTGHA